MASCGPENNDCLFSEAKAEVAWCYSVAKHLKVCSDRKGSKFSHWIICMTDCCIQCTKFTFCPTMCMRVCCSAHPLAELRTHHKLLFFLFFQTSLSPFSSHQCSCTIFPQIKAGSQIKARSQIMTGAVVDTNKQRPIPNTGRGKKMRMEKVLVPIIS